MPRQSRKKSSTGIYHVMLRGINKQDIFEEEEDYVRMKEILNRLNEVLTGTVPVSHVNRYGIDELTEWVNMPLANNVSCLDINEHRIIADETIRQLILKKCGAESITSFQLFSKERQKDIVRDVMMELGAGPRQMSRVTGLSYTLIYKACK